MNMVGKGPRQERPSRKEQKEDTRARVRDAARELFLRDGFDATTTKAIAERAGVAAGTVFVHARDKVDLLCLVMLDEIVAATGRAFETLPRRAKLRTQLLHVFGAVFDMYAANEALAAPFLRVLPGARGPNAERVAENTLDFLRRLSELVIEAQRRGDVDAEAAPLVVAQSVFALYYFSLTAWVAGIVPREAVLRPHLELGLDLLFRGLAPR